MKKKLEGELISIAHRVLKLKNRSETLLLLQETKKLYDQLTILCFYEAHFEGFKSEIPQHLLEEKLELIDIESISNENDVVENETLLNNAITEDKIQEAVFTEQEISKESFTQNQTNQFDATKTDEIKPIELLEKPADEEIYASAEEINRIVAEMASKKNVADTTPSLEAAIEAIKPSEPRQISFEDLLGESYHEPEFVRVENIAKEIEQAAEVVFEKTEDLSETSKMSQDTSTNNESVFLSQAVDKQKNKSVSLNDRLNKTISFGLNDKIAFEKKLFGGSADDFNRVISQLNTFDNFDEASSFITDFVKPDYKNWEGLEEYETRFLEIIEKKFN